MKFTSEDLMKAMCLQVGDKVKVKYVDGQFNETFETYEIKQGAGDTYMQSIDDGFIDSLAYLIDQDFEILPRPKRVGDLKCGFKKELGGIGSCTTCPVRIICGHYTCKDELGAGDTLYEYLETYKKKIKEEYDYEDEDYNDFDQEIYDLLKARLDKEVE